MTSKGIVDPKKSSAWQLQTAVYCTSRQRRARAAAHMKSTALLIILGAQCAFALAQLPVSKTLSGEQAPVAWQDGRPISEYTRNDPKQVYEWVAAKVASLGALDQFSTAAERTAHAEAMRAMEKEIGTIPLGVACDKAYDPERQLFEFSTRTNHFGSGAPDAFTSLLTGVDSTTKMDEYRGQNAYGASAMITRHNLDRYMIFTPRDSLSLLSGVTTASGKLKISVTIAPADARANQEDMSCLVVIAPIAPFSRTEHAGFSPTLKQPHDLNITIKGLVGRLTRMVVYNKSTGQIYRAGSATDNAEELEANSPHARDAGGRRKPVPAIRLTASVQEAYKSSFFSNDWSGTTFLNPGRLLRAGEDANGTFYKDANGHFASKIGDLQCNCGIYVPFDAALPAVIYRKKDTVGTSDFVVGKLPVDSYKIQVGP